MKGYVTSKFELSPADKLDIEAEVSYLDDAEREVLTDMLGVFTFGTLDEGNRHLFESELPEQSPF
jgi:hypothetical protein